MRFLPLIAIAASIALLGACAKGVKQADDVEPFVVPEDEFRRRVKIVGVAYTIIPDGMPDPAPIEAQFDSLIDVRLRKAHYTIVRPQQYETAFARAADELGLTPSTEANDSINAVLAEAMVKTVQSLKADFELDAVLIPRVKVVEAPFGGGRAEWDGTSQSIQSGVSMKSFLAGSPEGTVGALSLKVYIVSTAGNTLYENAGGIEILSKLEGNEFVLVPRQELLTDPKKIERAVKTALKPLEK